MNEEAKKRVDKLVDQLKGLFQDRLVSICVYGSTVFEQKPSEVPKEAKRTDYKDINVLVILDRLDHKDLEKASSIGKWWDSVAHSLPMFLSEEEWLRSHDVYAMEAADIRDSHYIAYGKDLFTHIEIDKAALRLICELELHRKLIFLRQRLLLHRDDSKALVEFLYSSVNSFAALFRGVLRLTHAVGTVPQQSRQVFESMKVLIEGYDPAPFLKVLKAREEAQKIPPGEVLVLFDAYVAQLSYVVHYVDKKFETVLVKEGVI